MINKKPDLSFKTTVPAAYRGEVTFKLDKIIKRGTKKGLSYIWNHSGSLSYTISPAYKVKVGKIFVSKVDVEVTGRVPQIDGWEFLGKLTHDAGNFVAVMSAPGKTVPHKYRSSKGHCDHCHSDRYRKDTFVICKDNKYLEIGRNCLKDFFPTINVELVIAWFNYIKELSQSISGGFSSVKVKPSSALVTMLMVSNAVIRNRGWLSKSAAQKINETRGEDEQQVSPTAYTIDYQLRVLLGFTNPDKYYVAVDILDSDEELAKKVINFVRTELKGDGEYEYNLRNFFGSDDVDLRYLPFVASAIPTYNRTLENAATRAKKTVSQYVGTVGEKILADVEVVGSKYIDTRFGSSLLVRMVDTTGNTFTTFTTSESFQPTIGDKFKIKGTVKSHNEWKGFKSTLLTRVKTA